jgi:predicted O-methyltransferase YrrM
MLPEATEKLMTTLTQPALSILLDRLFTESEAAEHALRPERENLSPEQRAADRADYRQYYGRLKDQPLPVSRATGKILYLLARAVRARNIVEFGTSFGISTLHLAAALRDNGGGLLIGSEFEPSKIVRARANLAAGNLADLVEIREGDALETLARDLPDPIDFVLLDGAKNLYPSILSLLEGRLRAGALIVADNADASPEYLARVRATAHGYISVPFADDVELSMRLGMEVPRNGAAPYM